MHCTTSFNVQHIYTMVSRKCNTVAELFTFRLCFFYIMARKKCNRFKTLEMSRFNILYVKCHAGSDKMYCKAVWSLNQLEWIVINTIQIWPFVITCNRGKTGTKCGWITLQNEWWNKIHLINNMKSQMLLWSCSLI